MKRARIGSENCPQCEAVLSGCEGVVQCSMCDLKFCIKCAKIPKDMLDMINSGACNIMWTCASCKTNFPSMSSMRSAITKLDSKSDERFKKMEDKLDSIDLNIHNKVKAEIKTLKTSLTEDIQHEVKKILGSELRTEMREIEDQKRRVNNLVCFNLPESKKQTASDKKMDDANRFTKICKDIGVSEVDITSCFRIGKPGTDRTRPLKVILKEKKHRNDIIQQARNIKTNCDGDLKNCIIVKDLTERQRNENKERRKKQAEERLETEAYENKTILSQPILHQKLQTVKGFDRECPVRTSTPAQKHGQRPPNNECIVGFSSSSALDVDDDETIIGGVMVYSNIGSGLNVSITDREEP